MKQEKDEKQEMKDKAVVTVTLMESGRADIKAGDSVGPEVIEGLGVFLIRMAERARVRQSL